MTVDYGYIQPWGFKGYKRFPISNFEWDSVPIQASIQEYVDTYGQNIPKGTPITLRAFWDDEPPVHIQVLVHDIPVGNLYQDVMFNDIVEKRISKIYVKIDSNDDGWVSYLFYKKDEL